jgi:hypothetical protein
VQRSSQKECVVPRLEDETKDALRRLSVPAEGPRFFEELRGRMQEHDRAAARRWRLTSLALGAAAVSALAAASVLAAASIHSAPAGKTAVVDRTISCRVAPTQYGVYVAAWVTIHRAADQNNPAYLFPANVGVTTWQRNAKPNDPRSPLIGQLAFNSAKKGVFVDRVRCRSSKRRVPLGPARLPSNGTNTESFKGGIQQVCRGAARILVHYRVTETGGVPQKAQVAVRDDNRRLTPLAYLDWTPKRVTTFTPISCSTYQSIANP